MLRKKKPCKQGRGAGQDQREGGNGMEVVRLPSFDGGSPLALLCEELCKVQFHGRPP